MILWKEIIPMSQPYGILDHEAARYTCKRTPEPLFQIRHRTHHQHQYQRDVERGQRKPKVAQLKLCG